MMEEAESQGWLSGELKWIPELESMCNRASDYFFEIIQEQEPEEQQEFMFHCCRYLFAKGNEGVILWGLSPSGRVSVFFHPRHLFGEFETEVPSHLHSIVLDTMPVGEALFNAVERWVIASQESGLEFDLNHEIKETLRWVLKLGIHHGLTKNLNAMR
jgi:hypothetical protein